MRVFLFLIFIIFTIQGCTKTELRGYSEASEDGQTYLVVMDDNGGNCGPIIVNNEEWPYSIGERGSVNAGEQNIECGGVISFDIKKGTTFYFNYWGP